MIYLLVSPKGDAEFSEFIVEYNKNEILQKFDIYMIKKPTQANVDDPYYATKYSTAEREPLLEMLIQKGAPISNIVDDLKKNIDIIDVIKELIIIDPYFFPKNAKSDYKQLTIETLRKYLPNIDDLIIITNPQFDKAIKNQIEADLQTIKPNLTIQHSTSDDFHDRYWISGKREKGIMIGTSLNGIGKKHCIVHQINKSDIRDIVSTLKSSNLIK